MNEHNYCKSLEVKIVQRSNKNDNEVKSLAELLKIDHKNDIMNEVMYLINFLNIIIDFFSFTGTKE